MSRRDSVHLRMAVNASTHQILRKSSVQFGVIDIFRHHLGFSSHVGSQTLEHSVMLIVWCLSAI